MKNIILWIGIVYTLTAPVLLGINGYGASISWVAASCGAFIILVAKFESLTELSLGPLKARMKEKLQEASATIEQLRKVAAVTSEATLTDLMAGGFTGGMNLKKRLELHDKVIMSLEEIGATEEQLHKAESDWKKGIPIIYHRAIYRAVEQRKDPNRRNTNAPPNALNASDEIQRLLDFENWLAPTPYQVRDVLERHKINSPEVDELISDYEHFIKTNEIRNIDKFIKQ